MPLRGPFDAALDELDLILTVLGCVVRVVDVTPRGATCSGVSIGYLLLTGSANVTSPYSCSPRSGFTSLRRLIRAAMVVLRC